jgi:hypothetical protein
MLHGGAAEDALQLLVYLAPVICRGCWQRTQACGHGGYVLAVRGEGAELLLHGPTCLQC